MSAGRRRSFRLPTPPLPAPPLSARRLGSFGPLPTPRAQTARFFDPVPVRPALPGGVVRPGLPHGAAPGNAVSHQLLMSALLCTALCCAVLHTQFTSHFGNRSYFMFAFRVRWNVGLVNDKVANLLQGRWQRQPPVFCCLRAPFPDRWHHLPGDKPRSNILFLNMIASVPCLGRFFLILVYFVARNVLVGHQDRRRARRRRPNACAGSRDHGARLP